MGERPDRLCSRCLAVIRNDQPWYTVTRLVYHEQCFSCVRCRRQITPDQYQENALGKIYCLECPLPRVPTQHQAAHLTASCAACDKNITGKANVSNSGNNYCEDCFSCLNCRCPIEGVRYFELLDELFCTDCEVQYRNKRYLLAKMGCGPPIKV